MTAGYRLLAETPWGPVLRFSATPRTHAVVYPLDDEQREMWGQKSEKAERRHRDELELHLAQPDFPLVSPVEDGDKTSHEQARAMLARALTLPMAQARGFSGLRRRLEGRSAR